MQFLQEKERSFLVRYSNFSGKISRHLSRKQARSVEMTETLYAPSITYPPFSIFMFNQKILFLLAIYISALFASNLLGMKTMPFLFGTHLSVAVFFLPFVFVTIDIVGQVYGPSASRMFVRSGFIALVFFLFANILSEYAPWSANTYARIGESYDAIFSLSFRVGIASLFAFLTSELIDVWVFFRAKQIFSNFFIASTISNIVSQ